MMAVHFISCNRCCTPVSSKLGIPIIGSHGRCFFIGHYQNFPQSMIVNIGADFHPFADHRNRIPIYI